jgi:putative endonuclease
MRRPCFLGAHCPQAREVSGAGVDLRSVLMGVMTDMTWHLYVIRTAGGLLYAGITTDVERRYQEHVTGGPKAARFLRAHPPKEIAFKRRIGTRSLALKVEYRFKQLRKRDKEAIVRAGRLRFDRKSGEIRN